MRKWIHQQIERVMFRHFIKNGAAVRRITWMPDLFAYEITFRRGHVSREYRIIERLGYTIQVRSGAYVTLPTQKLMAEYEAILNELEQS